MKDRKKTEDQIIAAVDRLILEKGFSSLGINAVSREAGISKVLIYRYFNDLDGLLDIWAKRNSYWTNSAVAVNSELPLKKQVKDIFHNYSNDLNNNKIKREILRGIVAQPSALGSKIMEKNEEGGYQLTRKFESFSKNQSKTDVKALFAILTAGLSYMALIKNRADLFNGIDINTEKGWMRLEDMVQEIIDTMMRD